MDRKALIEIAEKIEDKEAYDPELTREAFSHVAFGLPELDRQMIEQGALGSVDAILMVIDHGFPGWSISMQGTASEAHGDWTCSLRRSAERDNDAFMGVGRGAHLGNALIGALLKAMARRPDGE